MRPEFCGVESTPVLKFDASRDTKRVATGVDPGTVVFSRSARIFDCDRTSASRSYDDDFNSVALVTPARRMWLGSPSRRDSCLDDPAHPDHDEESWDE